MPGGPAQLHRHAGRRLVVGQGVARRRRRRRRAPGGRPARCARRAGRRGAARPHRRRRTWTRTRRTRGARCAVRRARTWRRPRTPWCRRCRARPPSRRAARTGRPARRGRRRRAASPAPGGATCRRRCVPAARTASSCSGRTFDGPQPNRPSAGSRSAGRRNVGGGGRRSLCQHGSRSSARSERVRTCRVACRPASPAIAESATLAVDAKAKALQAPGRGRRRLRRRRARLPDARAHRRGGGRRLPRPKNHRYSPAGGLPDLKEAIAVKTKRDSGFDCTAAQVLVTNGGKHAVFTAFAALCDPGDEVICPAPYWTTYPEAITLAGGVPKVVDTTEETGFQVTVEQLEAACTERTKVLLFVSPDNPSGAVYPPEQVAAIGRVGGRAGRVGGHRRDLRAPDVRTPRVHVDAGARPRPRRAVRRSSTASPRRTP